MIGLDIEFCLAAPPTRILNVNWICADSAPCLSVIRPRGGLARVESTVDTYKMEILVHRKEAEQERMIQKWSAPADSTTWSIEIQWSRLVEKGVRVPMQQCRNKLICVAPLLDDEAIANSQKYYYESTYLTHHFLVSVNYKGQIQSTKQEINIQRALSDGSGGAPKTLRKPVVHHGSNVSAPAVPLSKSKADATGNAAGDVAAIGKPSFVTWPQTYLNWKRRKNSKARMNTGLFSDDSAPANVPSYHIDGKNASQKKLKKKPEEWDHMGQADAPIVGADDSIQAVDEDSVDRSNVSSNGTLPWHQEVHNYVEDVYGKLGPGLTIAILITLTTALTFVCVCCIRRIKQKTRRVAMYRYRRMHQDESESSKKGKGNWFKSGKKVKEDLVKAKKSPGVNSANKKRGIKSMFWAARAFRDGGKRKEEAPLLSAAGRRVSFAEDNSDDDDDSDDDILNDEDEESSSEDDSDTEDSDSDSDTSETSSSDLLSKGKKTVGKVKAAADENETISKLKNRAENSDAFKAMKATAQNISEGKGPGPPRKSMFSRFADACLWIVCPIFRGLCIFCQCCFDFCRGNTVNRVQTNARKEFFNFLPSTGRKYDDSNEDSEDEIVFGRNNPGPSSRAVVTSPPEKEHSITSASGIPQAKKSNFIPKTDISGRFYVASRTKTTILRDNSNRAESCNVVYPSARSNPGQKHDRKIKPPLNRPSIVNLVLPQCGTSDRSNKIGSNHQCQLDAGDCSAIKPSSACKNDSVHSPKKQTCGLQCIQVRAVPTAKRQAAVETRPSSALVHIVPRLSRTPPPEDPRATSSSSEHEADSPSQAAADSLTPTTSSTSTDVEQGNEQRQELQHGDGCTTQTNALSRTKEFFKRENEHMDALLKSWEERTNGRTYANGYGRVRKMWVLNRRNRGREMVSEQEAKSSIVLNRTRENRATSAPVPSSDTCAARTASQRKVRCPPRSLHRGDRLSMPRMEDTSTANRIPPPAKPRSQGKDSRYKQTQSINIWKGKSLRSHAGESTSKCETTKETKRKMLQEKMDSIHSSEIDDAVGTGSSSGSYSEVLTDDVMRSTDDSNTSNGDAPVKSGNFSRKSNGIAASRKDELVNTKKRDVGRAVRQVVDSTSVSSNTGVVSSTPTDDGRTDTDEIYTSAPGTPRKPGIVHLHPTKMAASRAMPLSSLSSRQSRGDCPQMALRTAALDFLREEDEVTSSDDGEDEFWEHKF